MSGGVVALVVAALAVSPASAPAMTGGASPIVSTGTPEGGISFGAMRSAGATWYGPGLYGNDTACGQVLLPGTIGVAHRNLPCGTAVKFVHKGRQLVTRVIDRGPYTVGNAWDLTNGARLALDFEGVGRIRYALERGVIASRSARPRG
jgi:rare lipoprotein A (peptidoglycan hydrolase)